jgi:hypothetical protein
MMNPMHLDRKEAKPAARVVMQQTVTDVDQVKCS